MKSLDEEKNSVAEVSSEKDSDVERCVKCKDYEGVYQSGVFEGLCKHRGCICHCEFPSPSVSTANDDVDIANTHVALDGNRYPVSEAAPERIWINFPAAGTENNDYWYYENPMAFPTVEYARVSPIQEDDRQKAREVVAKWRAGMGHVVKYERMEADIAAALTTARAEGEAVGLERAAELLHKESESLGAHGGAFYSNMSSLVAALEIETRALSPDPDYVAKRVEAVWEKAIKVVAPWADAYKSCREHFDDPCCHVRLATTIVSALEAARRDGQNNDQRST